MSETSFKIKCSKSSSARRFSLSKPTIASLGSHVAASWGASGPSFWYVDDDGDRISVEHDHELQAAIAAVRDGCVTLNVDFNFETDADVTNAALALSPLLNSCHSSDDEDGFITVELHSESLSGIRAASPINSKVDAHSEQAAGETERPMHVHPDTQEVASTQELPVSLIDTPVPSSPHHGNPFINIAPKEGLVCENSAAPQDSPLLESTADSTTALSCASLLTDALDMLVHGGQLPTQVLCTRFVQTSTALALSEQERAEASATIAKLQREIQALSDALDSTQAQADRDAETARQVLQSTIEKAQARFEAATAVLSLELRKIKDALAAAEGQNVDAELHANAAFEVARAHQMASAAAADAAQTLERNRILLNLLEEVQSLNQELEQEDQRAQQKIEQLNVSLEHAAADQTQLRNEVDKWREEATRAQEAATASASLGQTAASRLHQIQQLQERNRQLDEALVSAVADCAHREAATEQRFLAELRQMSHAVDAAKQSAHSQVTAAVSNAVAITEARLQHDENQSADVISRLQAQIQESATIISELRAQNLLLQQRARSVVVEPAAAATSPPPPRQTRVQPPSSQPHGTGANRVAAARAVFVPQSPVSAPPTQVDWQHISRTVGAPQPSCSDVEKFERAMAVLRSMNLDESDDSRRCVVINNGDVLAVVDQILASSA
jgi:hypothetical protein